MLKKEVLRRKEDFARVYKKGESIPERYIVLFYMKNGLSYNRRALLASKKVGNSVQRNRARRLMRESCRLAEDSYKEGFDMIFIARKSINGKSFAEVDRSLQGAVKKGDLLKK